MGLHRFSAAVCANSPISIPQQRLWRRLWWTCFFRDRWLSLTMGRPLRINMNDCNTIPPSAGDMLSDFAGLPESISAAYVPKDLAQLADYWVILIQLTQLLGDTLTLCYQPFGASSSIEQVEALEQKILHFPLPENQGTGQSPLATFYLYHLQLHYQWVSTPYLSIPAANSKKSIHNHLLPSVHHKGPGRAACISPGHMEQSRPKSDQHGCATDQCHRW